MAFLRIDTDRVNIESLFQGLRELAIVLLIFNLHDDKGATVKLRPSSLS
jgi:hypothetical protein